MQFSTKKPKFFKPTSNIGFHKLFCTEGNDELVLQLLNAVIDDHRIVSFRRLDTVHQINADTSAIFDLYCTCDDGTRIIVECQNASVSANFMNRALAYSALAILDQARTRWRYDFEKVYFIGLLNYIHWHGRPQAITKVALYTENDYLLAQKNYLQIFVELPKLQAETDGDDFGRIFLRALRDIGESDERPEEYKRKDLDLLFRTSDYNNLNNEEKKSYDKNMTTVEDLMDYAKECGERAREEGKVESQRKIAKNLLELGADITMVSKATGLSMEEIKAL